MARFLAPLVLLTALFCATPAGAAPLAPKLYGGQAKLGVATSSESTKGACTITDVLTDVVLRCDSKGGTAQVTYLFTLPKSAGSVTTQVNFDGAHKGTSISTKRVSPTQFRATVTLKGSGRADIESVMIEYLYH
jgi:hypothetical protein